MLNFNSYFCQDRARGAVGQHYFYCRSDHSFNSIIKKGEYIMKSKLILLATMLAFALNGKTAGADVVCGDWKAVKQPFFGDLHVHTSYSFDAFEFGNTENDPYRAYYFAKGNAIPIPPFDAGVNQRYTRLDRPLDFAAVTDHAEYLEEREWENIKLAAHLNNDPCYFTTFNGYEYSLTPKRFFMQHRNVIFRNAIVPEVPVSYLNVPTPEGLWLSLFGTCLLPQLGCDVLAIPHNTNFSGGIAFRPYRYDGTPLGPADAAFRAAMEPLVEIHQAKGNSECRIGLNTNDELCNFEQINSIDHGLNAKPLSYVKNGLKEGLRLENSIGVNPFKFGFIGSTDTHNGTAGKVEERNYPGKTGITDDTPEERLAFKLFPFSVPSPVTFNPGGLAVVWAEQNTRDSIFDGMKKKESYATSGTRPEVCSMDADTLVQTGYAQGVPMGSTLSSRADESPQFIVFAEKDQNLLQRIQIIKGWTDPTGNVQEKVIDVVGDTTGSASVNTDTCEVSGPGYDRLCKLWEDTEYNAFQNAFYYARVLENPSCRWSQHECNRQGVNCEQPDSVPPEFASCCFPVIPKTIQERAWTSPIWIDVRGGGN
jgi:hypothetical protein